jgi:hypothetical protein
MSAQNDIHTPRWVLYHGTSTRRLNSIHKDGCLGRSQAGDRLVSMTTELCVAQYFACAACFEDRRDYPEEQSEPVVVVLDGERMLEVGYELASLRDEDVEEAAWEHEISCDRDIQPLAEVFVKAVPTPAACWEQFQYNTPDEPFVPPGVPMVEFALHVMAHVTWARMNGDVAAAEADAAVQALEQLRTVMRAC